MTEFTVHFQKGFRVGARSLRMVTVEATDENDARRKAKAQFNEPGYKLTRIDFFENGRLQRGFPTIFR